MTSDFDYFLSLGTLLVFTLFLIRALERAGHWKRSK